MNVKYPQFLIERMRAEYEALPRSPSGLKPWGSVRDLARKYGISYGYANSILRCGYRKLKTAEQRELKEVADMSPDELQRENVMLRKLLLAAWSVFADSCLAASPNEIRKPASFNALDAKLRELGIVGPNMTVNR